MAINDEVQRRQFGGFNFGAAFFGWLVAVAVEVLLIALFTAVGGAVALTNNVSASSAQTVGLVGAVLLLVAMAAAYYSGGYVAGRMSRFDGGRQGVGVWVMGVAVAVLLAIAGGILGANYNLLQQINLPNVSVNPGTLTTGGLVTLLLGLAVTFLAALIGGKVGENYHRRVDEAGVEVPDQAVEPVAPAVAPAQRYQPTFGERIERSDRADRPRRDL